MYALRNLMILGLGLVFTLSVRAQFPRDLPIELEGGNYELLFLLEEIKNSGVPLAFSSSKIPKRRVVFIKGETLLQLLRRLQREKIIQYQFSDTQILIIRYQASKYTLNGVIKDSETGEYLIGASIQVDGTSAVAITNGYGHYSITIKEGTHDFHVKHVGYKNHVSRVIVNKNVHINIFLQPTVLELKEVEINSLFRDVNISSNTPSVNRIDLDDHLGEIPYLLGEVDVLKNALLKPGISSVGEDANGIHIRGGRVDQNLILLDEAIIYNPNHYILASVFNPEAVNDVKIYKGFIPPSYGGRTASVIHVRQKEGNNQEMGYSGGIGPFSVRGLIEGPLKRSKGSFLASARQSLINLDVNDFGSNSVRRSRNRFQDINLKINLRPNTQNAYYLSGYFGNDRNSIGLNSIRNWGNRMVNFRWNRLFSPRVFSNFSTFVSDYNYRVESTEEPGAFVSTSKIVNYSLKSDFTFAPLINHEISFGFSNIFHKLKPGERLPFDSDASTNTIKLDDEHGLESAWYIGHQANIGRIQLNYGLRYSALHSFGPHDMQVYSPNVPISDSTVIDTLSFKKGKVIKKYFRSEPRIAVNWKVNKNTAVKAAYSRSVQYLHLISNTLDPSPTDIWKLSDPFIPPSVSELHMIGFYKNFKNHQWESSVELYYKNNINDIVYRDGADLIFNEHLETELFIEKGRAYGLEFYLNRKYGKVTGWISYTLSKTETRINEGGRRTFVVNNFDRTHDFSTTWVMKVSDRGSVSGNFVYATGIPLTLPSDKYFYEENLVPLFVQRNTARLPSYHRMDLSFKLEGKKIKKGGGIRKNRSAWIFTLYNVYARKNANSYFFRQSEQNRGVGEIVQYSVFGTIIPAVTYTFKF